MGKKIERNRSKTLPSSPTHSFSSSSSSDFEFRISLSPRKSSAELCPADELFYKGKILPLQTSSRISMVRTLLLASSSTSSSDTTTTASRDSSSSNDSTSSSFAADLSLLANGDPCCDSTRPSSATDDDNINNININININNSSSSSSNNNNNGFKRYSNKKPPTNSTTSASSKYFSLSRFSNVFKKDNINLPPPPPLPLPVPVPVPQPKENNINNNNAKKINPSAKDVIRKYLKKVKPLYDKLSSKHPGRSPCVGGSPVLETTSSVPLRTTSTDILLKGTERSSTTTTTTITSTTINASSFSGNIKCNNNKLMKRGYVASCPSSMRSSPSHSGVLTRTGLPARPGVASTSQGSCSYLSSDASTMEELQNAIQGAIAHCKSSMLQCSTSSFNNNVNQHSNNNMKCKAFEI
ncbi:putative membrane-associated kinase regulator 1 [Silene latifolia]|uniref:putative membrane-associated kinase regulator 1 n=1 Tax=Silene latifolia TaxID=37657 RepID=UPI003D76AD30